MKKLFLRLIMSGLLVLTVSANGFSGEMAGKEKMSPEQKEMMAKMMAYSTPNENHALLASLAGSWTVTVEHKMKADSPAETSNGISRNIMIFDGRFLEQSYQGDMNGKPFDGKGIIGYNNILKKFQSIWYDSMGTGIMSSTATYDPAKKTFNEEGYFSCPMTDDQRWFRGAITLLDDDHYTYEMFIKDNGKEFRSLLIQYSRTK